MASNGRILRVGMVGCGEVAQVVWLPTLSLLDRHFRVKSIYDISPSVVDFCLRRYSSLASVKDPVHICEDPEIDVVFVLSSDDMHEAFARVALGHGKNVFVEKPMTLSSAR